jgi:hypothetical protein
MFAAGAFPDKNTSDVFAMVKFEVTGKQTYLLFLIAFYRSRTEAKYFFVGTI